MVNIKGVLTDSEVKEVVDLVAAQMIEEFGKYYYESMNTKIRDFEITKRVISEMQRIVKERE